jgi:hypothetical protein
VSWPSSRRHVEVEDDDNENALYISHVIYGVVEYNKLRWRIYKVENLLSAGL